eukprot:1432484-Amphidinium_carterae.1
MRSYDSRSRGEAEVWVGEASGCPGPAAPAAAAPAASKPRKPLKPMAAADEDEESFRAARTRRKECSSCRPPLERRRLKSSSSRGAQSERERGGLRYTVHLQTRGMNTNISKGARVAPWNMIDDSSCAGSNCTQVITSPLL